MRITSLSRMCPVEPQGLCIAKLSVVLMGLCWVASGGNTAYATCPFSVQLNDVTNVKCGSQMEIEVKLSSSQPVKRIVSLGITSAKDEQCGRCGDDDNDNGNGNGNGAPNGEPEEVPTCPGKAEFYDSDEGERIGTSMSVEFLPGQTSKKVKIQGIEATLDDFPLTLKAAYCGGTATTETTFHVAQLYPITISGQPLTPCGTVTARVKDGGSRWFQWSISCGNASGIALDVVRRDDNPDNLPPAASQTCRIEVTNPDALTCGTIVLRAEPLEPDPNCCDDDPDPCYCDDLECYAEANLTVGCSGDGDDGNCTNSCPFSTGNFNVGSVRIDLSLGRTESGDAAGAIFMHEDSPDHLVRLSSLQLAPAGDVGIENVSESLRKVTVPDGVVELEFFEGDPLEPDEVDEIEVRFHSHDNLATPFRTWAFRQPTSLETFHLRISDGETGIYEYTHTTNPEGWTLVEKDMQGNVLRIRSTNELINGVIRTEIYEVRDDQNVLVYRRETDYQTFNPGADEIERKIEERVDTQPGETPEPMTTSYGWYTNDPQASEYGQLKYKIEPDERWELLTYDSSGRIASRVTPWKDVTLEDAMLDPTLARQTEYEYVPVDPTENNPPTIAKFQPRTMTERIEGHVVAVTYRAYFIEYDQGTDTYERVEIVERAADVTNNYGDDDPPNLRSIYRYHADWLEGIEAGRLHTVESPDGRLDTYGYARGTYPPGGNNTPGTFTPNSEGDHVRTTVVQGTVSSPDGIENKTTKTVSVRNPAGRNVLQERYVYDGSTHEGNRIEWTVRVYDHLNRDLGEYFSNNTYRTFLPSDCCGPEFETDIHGIETQYQHDGRGRLEHRIKTQFDTFPAITTTYAYNLRNLVTEETTSAGSLSLTRLREYDMSGRQTRITDEAGLETVYAYLPADQNNPRRVRVTRPGGTTEETAYYLDGRIKSVTGTAVVERHYTYGIDSQTGLQWTHVVTGDPQAQDPPWTRAYTDGLGRTVREERPGYDGGTVVTISTYDDAGRLVKTTVEDDQSNPLQAPTLYVYDELGNIVRTGLDVDDSGTLEPDSQTDRIQGTVTAYEDINGDWWQLTKSGTYPHAGIGDPFFIINHTQKRRLSGFATGGANGDLIEEIVSIDIYGNETIAKAELDRQNRKVTRTIERPDSDTDEVQVVTNGLQISHVSKIGATTTFEHDDLGRHEEISSPNTGTVTTAYHTTGTGSIGKVAYTEDEDGYRICLEYDEATGRQSSITTGLKNACSGTGAQITYFAYSDRGEQTHVWGSTYPVEYVYDDYGRRETMTTFRADEGWTGTEWPSEPDGDTTTWVYEPATGLLLEKRYADHTQQNPRNIVYTYTVDGKLATRTWAREVDSQPLVTTYDYDTATGDLLEVAYSDDTPDIEYTYDRLGRIEAVKEGGESARSFVYDFAKLHLLREDFLRLGGEPIWLFSRQHDYETSANDGIPGRPAGLRVREGIQVKLAVTYGYDDVGRLEHVAGPGLPDGGVTYGFVPNSSLVKEIAYQDDSENTLASTTFTYEFDEQGKHRPVRTVVENERDHSTAPLVSKYTYRYDDLGRRKDVVLEGAAFAATVGDHHWQWGYNERSELATADWCEGTDPTANCTHVVAGWAPNYRYEYDPIGNRVESQAFGEVYSYDTNSVNQYEGWSSLHGHDEFDYDPDGNLIADFGSTFAWDAENRLVAVEPKNPNQSSRKVEFDYDYMSRRVRKRVYEWNGAVENWDLTTDILFLYDQWNVVMVLEVDGQSTNVRSKYTWGLDLSGQNGNPTASGIHGAGGIGGLLAVEETATSGSPSYWFFYDANGNVGQVVEDATDYPIAGHYEYDPYGNRINNPTGYGAENPFRFSTKWWDAELRLYYYGYRYYHPWLGRWTSRDRIEEQGGVNLYLALDNNSIHITDALGQWGDDVHYSNTKQWAESEGYITACAEIIAKANKDVDSYLLGSGPMYFVGDFRYHFDMNKEGTNTERGARDGRIQYEHEQARKQLEHASNWSKVRIGLEHVGRALHPLQDKYSHNASHTADTPFKHAPREHCIALGDPGGTRVNICIDARKNNDNWDDPHRPDNPAIWPADHIAAELATKNDLRKWLQMECVACYCGK